MGRDMKGRRGEGVKGGRWGELGILRVWEHNNIIYILIIIFNLGGTDTVECARCLRNHRSFFYSPFPPMNWDGVCRMGECNLLHSTCGKVIQDWLGSSADSCKSFLC